MRAPRSQRQWARLAPGTGSLIFTPAYVTFVSRSSCGCQSCNYGVLFVLINKMREHLSSREYNRICMSSQSINHGPGTGSEVNITRFMKACSSSSCHDRLLLL